LRNKWLKVAAFRFWIISLLVITTILMAMPVPVSADAAGIDEPGVLNIALQIQPPASTGLFWDFQNATSSGGISTSIGTPTSGAISGKASQTGGGPAENFGGTFGIVHLTRFLGPVNYPYIEFTTTNAMNLESISFLHVHNHNTGFPTQNGYQVQLQIDSGSGYSNIGSPLAVNSSNSGQTSTITLGSALQNPGTYRIRWLASGFISTPSHGSGSDSNTEFFAIDNLALNLVDTGAKFADSLEGTTQGTPSGVTYTSGYSGQGALFDNSLSDYIQYPQSRLNGPQGTIQFYWKPPTNDVTTIPQAPPTHAPGMYAWFMIDSVNEKAAPTGSFALVMGRTYLYWSIWTGSSWPNASWNTPANFWDTSRWYKIAVSYGPKGLQLYVDDVLRASNLTYTGGVNTGSTFALGGNQSDWYGSLHGLPGTYDELRIYNTQPAQVNTPPAIAAAASTVTVNEGSTAANSGTYSDVDPGQVVSVTASVGTVTGGGTQSGTWNWSYTPSDGPAQSTVTITANDGNGGVTTAAFALTVNNVPPTIALSGNNSVDEGSPYTLNLGAITNPGTDTVSGYKINWGDSASNILTGIPSGTKTHTYADGPNNYTITVDLTDEDGTFTGAGSKAVTVNNTAPTVNAGPDATINEGGTFTGGSSGLVAWYRAEGNASDSAGSNNGTVAGVTYAAGKLGQAFDINGNQYVEAPDSASLDISSNITLAAWIYPRSLGGRIVDKITAGANDGYLLDTLNNRLRLIAIGGPSGSSILPTGSWVHVAGVYDGSQIRLYVNGAPDGTGPATGPIPTNNLTLKIGNAHGAVVPFNGLIDDVRIYNRALSAADIQALASGTPPAGAFTDPGSDTFTATVNYGDGSDIQPLTLTGDTFTLNHIYADNGTYTVTVTVRDDDNGTGTDTVVVTVNNVAPTITSVSNNSPINEGSSATITVTATDPAGANDPLNYEFDANNDNIYEIGPQPGSTRSITFGDNGSFRVNVRVSDGDGGVATSFTTVVVNNVAPTITSVSSSGPINEGSSATITVATADPAGANDPLSYEFDANNDGTYEIGPQPGNTTSVTFGDNGSFRVNVRVSDGDGGTTTGFANIVVNNVAPTPGISGAPSSSPEGTAIALSGSATDPSSADTAAGFTYAWSVTKNGNPYTSGGNVTSFSFTPDDNGSYVVTLNATDKDGGIGATSKTIAVTNVAPASVTPSVNPATINENGSATVSGTFTDPGILDTHTVVIIWGDGSPNTNINLAANVLSFNADHPYLDNKPGNAAYTVSATVMDKDSASGSGSTTVTVNNIAPTVNAGSDATINEGGTFSSSGSFTDPGADTWTATVDYGDGTGVQALTLTGKTFSLSHVYADNGAYTITVAVKDDDNAIGTDTAMVTVNNVAPTVNAGTDATINEGSAFSSSGSFTDPGADTWTATVDYGDGSGVQDLTLTGKVFSLSHVYADNGSYTVTVTVKDDDNGVGTDTAVATVNNVAPVVNAGNDATVNEGSTFSSSGSFTDPGADTWTATVDYGDGTGVQDLTLTGKTFSLSHVYADNGAYTVTVTVKDDDNGAGTDTAVVTVNNVAPASVTLNATPAVINENSSTTVSGTFTDPGILDSHTVVVTWGDSSPNTSLNLAANVLSFSATHQYLDNKPGNAAYTVSATVTDKDSASGSGSTTVTVNNVAPAGLTISATPPTINENDSTTVSGSFTDPGTLDTHNVVIEWGDGSLVTNVSLAANVLSFGPISHKYLDNLPGNAPYTINATVTDKDGGVGGLESSRVTVTVNNVPPTATFNAPASFDRRHIFPVSLTSPVDPSPVDTTAGFTYAVDCGSGYSAFGSTSSATCMANNMPGTQTVKGKIQDKDGGVTEYPANVTIFNVPPVATVLLSYVSIGSGGPFTNDILTASATKSDVDNYDNEITLTFVWKKTTSAGVTTVLKTTADSSSLTDTYDLMTPGNGDKNDTITVEVTPRDDIENGAMVSAQTVVKNSPPVAAFKFTLWHDTTFPVTSRVKRHSTDPLEGSRIQFEDLSYDPDPGDTIQSRSWSIRGPVTGPNLNLVNLTSTVQNPYFRPPDNGVYEVILTVNGSDNTSTTVTSPTQGLTITTTTTCSVHRELCQPTTVPATNRPTVRSNGDIILALRLKVANTPPKVNALNIEVRSGDGATLFGRFLDHGWLDKHTATWKLDNISTPFPGTVKESNTAIVDTGIVTASLTSGNINSALAAAGNPPLPATLWGTLTVWDNDKNSQGYHAGRTDRFTVTVRADNPSLGEPNNDLTTFSPPVRTTGSVYLSYIQSDGDKDIFEVVQPNGTLTVGSEVLVTLKGLPADFDVALLTKLPAGAGSRGQFGTAPFDVNNFKISGFDDGGFDDGGFDDGGFDDGGFDDGGFDDGGFDDGGFDDGGFDDGGFDDGGFDDGGFDDGGILHGGFDDGGFDDGGFDDGGSFENSSISNMSNTGVAGSNISGTDLQLSELALGSILTPDYTVAAFSANRGQKDEVILTRIAVSGTRLFVVVSGSNGARSATPYQLQIESSSPVATVFPGNKLVNPPALQTWLRQDAAPKTLFVTQRERLMALYNMDNTAWNTLQGKLVTLAGHSAVQGDILSLPSVIYDNWDLNPSSVDEANNTTVQIRNIIQTYLAGKPGIQNVVMVGSDDVVPFRRVPDETVIANERYYLRSSYLKLGSPLFSSVMLGNNLTDDYYVSFKPLPWQGRELYIPELSVGRLVETPQEIAGAADAFLSVGGNLSPTTAFVAGYDFFSDGAQVVASNLAAGGIATDSSLINSTWTANELKAKLLGPAAKDINAPNAHFTHYAALSASGFANKTRDIMTTLDVNQALGVNSAPNPLLRRALFTIGCHSGLNVPDRESRAVPATADIKPALDFPQALAQQQAISVINTGYGLGDTDGLAGTELLLTYLAKNMVQGDITMGKALIGAKQMYLSSTSPLTVYEEKSSIQATLYGLPMYRIQVAPPAASPAPSGSNILTITDGGSTTTALYNLEAKTNPNGTYYTANGDVQATPGRPVEPRIVKLLSNTGGNVHGVLLTGATFTDSPDGFNPVINRPTTEWEMNPTEPQTALPSFWPYQPGTVNSLTLSNSVIQSLVVTPGQFKATSAPGTTVTGIQRLYSKLSLELLRSISSDWQPPVIQSVDFRGINDTTVAVTVNASDPSGISRIVVLRLSNGTFTPTSQLTTGTGPFTINVSPFSNGDTILVEVVDGAGNIAMATGKGASFHVIKVDASVTQVHSPGKPVIFRGVISGFDALPKPVQYTLDFGDGTFADGQVNSATFTVQHMYNISVKQVTTTEEKGKEREEKPRYVISPQQVTAALKVTDVGGGVGNDQMLLIFDSAGDVHKSSDDHKSDSDSKKSNGASAAAVSAMLTNEDLVGSAVWIDSTNMTIVLGVKGVIASDIQYRVSIDLESEDKDSDRDKSSHDGKTVSSKPTGNSKVEVRQPEKPDEINLRYRNGKATGLKSLTASVNGNQLTFTFKLSEVGLKSADHVQIVIQTRGADEPEDSEGTGDRMPDKGEVPYVLY